MTYTVKKILELIRMYHVNINNIKKRQREYQSVGVSVISDMPKANNISDTVANEALRLIRDDRMFQLIESDVKYIQDRLDRVTEKEDAIILSMRLNGRSVRDIAEMHNVSERTIHRRLEKIAMLIQGYTG